MQNALGSDFRHSIVTGPHSDVKRLVGAVGSADVAICPSLSRNPNIWRDLASLVWFRKHIQRCRPDVVVTHQSKASAIGRMSMIGRGWKPKLVQSESMASSGPGYTPIKSRGFRLVERLGSDNVSRYVAVGVDLAVRLEAAGVSRDRCSVVRSYCGTDRFLAERSKPRGGYRREFGLDELVPVLLFVGSLVERKGANRLVAIAESVSEKIGRQVVLLIAGEGPLREHQERASAVLPDVDVRFLGYSTRVPELMRSADVLMLPTAAEGLPQVLVQAAMVGTPFVSYDVDGVRELIEMGCFGRSVSLFEEESFVDEVVDVLRTKDPKGPLDESMFASWQHDQIMEDYRKVFGGLLKLPTESVVES